MKQPLLLILLIFVFVLAIKSSLRSSDKISTRLLQSNNYKVVEVGGYADNLVEFSKGEYAACRFTVIDSNYRLLEGGVVRYNSLIKQTNDGTKYQLSGYKIKFNSTNAK